ncbi:MAG: sugar phosphate nucleotidyltransferase, partial [Pseudomonadota bacterium]|nr:sugar phosphate nucleotidyltransferase [Pseudomonadota bacterium]
MSKNSRPTTIVPVILSRGSTNRLWPMSREAFPEHLLSLIGANTKDTDSAGLTFAAPIIVCKQEHRFPVATQLKELGIRPAAIIIEQPRGGALTSCAIAGLIAAVTDSQNILLIIPADHLVRDMEAFHTALI